MSTVEELLAKLGDAEAIATDPSIDFESRRRANERSLDLRVLIDKQAEEDRKEQARQDAKRQAGEEYNKKIQSVLDEMTATDNALAKAPQGSVERSRLVDRSLALRLKLDNLTRSA